MPISPEVLKDWETIVGKTSSQKGIELLRQRAKEIKGKKLGPASFVRLPEYGPPKPEKQLEDETSQYQQFTTGLTSEGPTEEQTGQYRKTQKESGRCENCDGFCVLDWRAEASGGKPK